MSFGKKSCFTYLLSIGLWNWLQLLQNERFQRRTWILEKDLDVREAVVSVLVTARAMRADATLSENKSFVDANGNVQISQCSKDW